MVYHTTDGTIKAYGNLKEVESVLSGKMFVRCNSCYLVNLNYVYAIRGYTGWWTETSCRSAAPEKKAFVQAVNDYLGVASDAPGIKPVFVQAYVHGQPDRGPDHVPSSG